MPEARASATPSALKIAARALPVSSPSIRRTCTVSPASSDRRSRKPCGEVGAETAGARQVGVRGDERPTRALDDDHRERLVGRRGRHPERAVGEPGRHGSAERDACGVDLGLGVVRLDLEREVESARARELGEQVVEDRHAGRDVRRARPLGDARTAHRSTRSIDAPRACRRSSIRSYPRSIWPMFPIVERPSAQSAAITIAIPARMSGLSSRCP